MESIVKAVPDIGRMIPAILIGAILFGCRNNESPRTSSITVEQRQAAIESATELLHADRVTEALAITSTLIKRDPYNPQSQETHALALIAEGWKLDNVGNSMRANEKRSEALQSYFVACEHSTNPGLLQLSTAQLAHMIGDNQTAKSYYTLAHTNVPLDPRASFFLGQIAMLQNEWEEAKGWISESLKRDPTQPHAILSLALIEAESEHPLIAVDLAAKGCSLLPNDPNIRFIQARVLRLTGSPYQAYEILSTLPDEFRLGQICQDEIKDCLNEFLSEPKEKK